MNTYTGNLKSLIADEQAGSLVEYGLLLSMIAIACIVALISFGGALKTLFSNAASDLNGGAAPAGPPAPPGHHHGG